MRLFVKELLNVWQRALGVSRFVAVVCVLAVASLSLNVLLAGRLRSLSQTVSARMTEHRLKAGASVPPINANRFGGPHELISYQNTNQATVLYVFTPPCSWCGRNLDNFKTLVEKEGRGYHFVGLSLSDQGLAEYVMKNNLKLPVYSGLSSETLKTYKLGSTPQTIVISPEGKVLQDWVGAYVGDQKSQVEAFFHVSLPGLRDLQK